MSNAVLDWNAYLDCAVKAVAEGIVMLKNDAAALPLPKNETIALFGRIQFHYYKGGTGSGGMVNVSHVTSILEGLEQAGVPLQSDVLNAYRQWVEENPYQPGTDWGGEPWSQQEMPLEDALVRKASADCERAIVVIGRTAGEEQENAVTPGSYLLTETELAMLQTVRRHFRKMIVLLNVGNLIDLSFLDTVQPDALLYVWQGGMIGGTGTAQVLTGAVSPSGKLPDTIAYRMSDYPSDAHFGNLERNCYVEDIFVGYRYFETFAQDSVRYPFGFGMSYTQFAVQPDSIACKDDTLTLTVSIQNVGGYAGKEVVQLYCELPQGKLGQPARILCAFAKTKTIAPGGKDTVTLTVSLADLAAYDDSGITGHPYARVLEAGSYRFYLGTDVRQAACVYEHTLPQTIVTAQYSQALAPVTAFDRMCIRRDADGYTLVYEPVPTLQIDEQVRRIELLPAELKQTGHIGIKLADVLHGKASMDAFIAQLTDDDLTCIIRGEGMGSPKVTLGTAAAFGGVSEGLADLGIPCGCCADGPAGLRLDCGWKAFSLPIGTMLAATFNLDLVRTLFGYVGLEMRDRKVDCLLGPGMNLHRHPLNGRNFEYFSEDPYLTGMLAAAELQGLQSVGVTGVCKHFAGNNQETGRHVIDSIVSERALRDLYLRSFELAVRHGNANAIMTTYGSLNGIWTAGHYDLCTTILRRDWGFEGFVMTDWWANISERGAGPNKRNFAAMARAQNDVYMVCADGAKGDDNTAESLRNGILLRCELQRNAANICRFLLHTQAMQRLLGTEVPVTVLHRPEEESDNVDSMVSYDLDGSLILDLTHIPQEKGAESVFSLNISQLGNYRVTLVASSEQSELAQLSVSLFTLSTPSGIFTWNGTGGKPVAISKTIPLFSNFTAVRIYVGQAGLKLHEIRFEKV